MDGTHFRDGHTNWHQNAVPRDTSRLSAVHIGHSWPLALWNHRGAADVQALSAGVLQGDQATSTGSDS